MSHGEQRAEHCSGVRDSTMKQVKKAASWAAQVYLQMLQGMLKSGIFDDNYLDS